VADLPFDLPDPLAQRLRAAADIEGKIVRALEALGQLSGRDVAILDVPRGPLRDRLLATGLRPHELRTARPFQLDLPDHSVDAVLTLWNGFEGVRAEDLDEADRVLRSGGRLLVVHDYGRDDVSALADAARPQYREWSHRDGPFLRDGRFKIRVLHCFWTFASVEDGQAFLGEAFGPRGHAVAARMKRPRLSWNVAVYHRWRGGSEPAGAGDRRRSRGRGGRQRAVSSIPATLARMSRSPSQRRARVVATPSTPTSRRGPHLGPLRITPLRVTLTVALAGGLAFLAWSVFVRDANQVPMMATGLAVCGIVFGVVAAMSVRGIVNAGREGRDATAVLTALAGGLIAIAAMLLIAGAVIMSLIWSGTKSG
jgi:hypothetical protein